MRAIPFLTLLGATACSVRIGGPAGETASPDQQTEPKRESALKEGPSSCEVVCSSDKSRCTVQVGPGCTTEQARQKQREFEDEARAEREKKEREERDRESRQSDCRDELSRLKNAETEKGEGVALAQCSNSKLPPGEYRSAKDSVAQPYVQLQVTDAGCAAYDAFRHGTITDTKVVESRDGYRELEYKRDWSCSSRGVVTETGASDPREFKGQCIAPGATPTKRATWEANGAGVVVNDPAIGAVQLRRVAASVEADANGLPPLWPKTRRQFDDQARASVAFGSSATVGACRDRAAQRAQGWQLSGGPTEEECAAVLAAHRDTPPSDWCAELDAFKKNRGVHSPENQ